MEVVLILSLMVLSTSAVPRKYDSVWQCVWQCMPVYDSYRGNWQGYDSDMTVNMHTKSQALRLLAAFAYVFSKCVLFIYNVCLYVWLEPYLNSTWVLLERGDNYM